MRKYLAFILSMLLTGASVAHAGEPVLLGAYGDWKAFSFSDSKGRVCFMTAKPVKQEGKFTKRGDVSFFITHWAAENNKDVVSVSAGYDFKKDSSATIIIDDKKFTLFTDGELNRDMAWAENSDTDRRIADAVRRGSSMTVKGTSARGTETKDTYSLKGSADAYDKISRECGF